MELLHMSKDPMPMTLPLLPGSGGGVGGSGGKPAALKAGSLSRFGDLQQYLRQCDDQNYLKNYVKVLGSLPRDLLEDLTRTLKARSAWLSCEEQREYKRAKLLNVITCPADGSPQGGGHQLGGSTFGGCGGSPGGGMLGGGVGLAGACSPCGGAARADADAFCSQVLLGSSDAPACAGQSPSAVQFELAAGSEAQLAGLEMSSEGVGEEGQPFMPGAATPFTPLDAPRTKMRLLPPQQGQGLQPAAGAGGSAAEARLAVAAAAAAEPGSTGGKSGTPQDASPPLAGLAAAGVTDHQMIRISPDGSGEQAATLAAAAQQQQAALGRGGGGSRVRQATLLPDKQSQ